MGNTNTSLFNTKNKTPPQTPATVSKQNTQNAMERVNKKSKQLSNTDLLNREQKPMNMFSLFKDR